MPDLSARDRQPEVMDDPALPPGEHHAALAGLARINRVSRTVAGLWRPLADRMRADPGRAWRLLDVACGSGDVAIGLAKRATAAGLTLRVEGCDISETALADARRRAVADKTYATFVSRDVLAHGLPAFGEPGGHHDFITCSLFLHHLDEPDAIRLLRTMGGAAGTAAFVSDLRRGRLGYAMALVACHGLSRSRVVHIDGPLSVRAAFTMTEASALVVAAGLSDRVRLERTWPQRFLMTVDGAAR